MAGDGATYVLKELGTDYTSQSINPAMAADVGRAPKGFLEINTTSASGLSGGSATQTIEIYTAVRNRPTDYFLLTSIHITATGTTATVLSGLGRYVAYKSQLPSGAKPEWEMLLSPKD